MKIKNFNLSKGFTKGYDKNTMLNNVSFSMKTQRNKNSLKKYMHLLQEKLLINQVLTNGRR